MAEYIPVNLYIKVAPVDLITSNKTLISRVWENENNFSLVEEALDEEEGLFYVKLYKTCARRQHDIRSYIKYATSVAHAPTFDLDEVESDSAILIVPCEICVDHLKELVDKGWEARAHHDI